MATEPTRAPTPAALTLSVICGVIGTVLLLIGVVANLTALYVAAFAAGTVSLCAALYWRSQLITDWRDAHGQHRQRGDGF